VLTKDIHEQKWQGIQSMSIVSRALLSSALVVVATLTKRKRGHIDRVANNIATVAPWRQTEIL
jgi:hypothetical protein